MIRYVALGGQLHLDEEGVHDFAFYDTVPARFVTIWDAQVFDSLDDLVTACRLDPMMGADGLSRLLRLIPPTEESGS